MFMVGAYLIYNTVPHVTDRVDIWLDPYQDPGGAGYQVLQSMFAQAHGGLFGEGFARSLLVIPGGSGDALLPATHTDLIYSLIVSETGLFGGAAVVLTYVLIAARGFKTAALAEDGFSKLLAAGLTAVFALQALVAALWPGAIFQKTSFLTAWMRPCLSTQVRLKLPELRQLVRTRA